RLFSAPFASKFRPENNPRPQAIGQLSLTRSTPRKAKARKGQPVKKIALYSFAGLGSSLRPSRQNSDLKIIRDRKVLNGCL
ncbi:hypothetical protein, partial [Uliginosibacterium sediminicola]